MKTRILCGGTALDSIEKAIRSAFEKGDPSERTYREKVYRSAFAALDRALQSNPNVTQEMVARRRQALSTTISAIESEFLPAVPAVEPTARQSAPVEPQARRPATARAEPSFEPTLEGEERNSASRSDYSDDEVATDVYVPNARPSRRNRSWVATLVTIAVVALVGIGAWWLFAPPGPESFPRPTEDAEDFTPEPAEPGLEAGTAPIRTAGITPAPALDPDRVARTEGP